MLKKACLAAGLVSCWGPGSTAQADVGFRVTVTPSYDLTNAFVYLGNNVSTADIVSLGDLPANVTSVRNVFLNRQNSSFGDDPRNFEPFESYIGEGYGWFVVGEYSGGLAITFADPNPLGTGKDFAEVFEFIWWYTNGYQSEDEVLSMLRDANEFLFVNYSWDLIRLGKNFRDETYDLTQAFGSSATFVAFSSATPAGSASVAFVPEASTTLLSGLGLLLGLIATRSKWSTNGQTDAFDNGDCQR